ncbi:MAG: hypothetical protein L6R42_005647 [Xanthoria sp. 1 TBL-2021]|nr:MAG: hypothetical protein L6R42_005647 [Xanthoria sp. 1 TBL-2021]
MHFPTTYLALALSLSSSAIARPQQGQYQQQQPNTTFNGGYDTIPSGGEDAVPKQCKMFMPYVPPALLGAVCSLHMTPLPAGSMPVVPTSCLSADRSQTTIDENDSEDQYEAPYQPQPTTALQNVGYQRQAANNYGATTTSKPTTTYGLVDAGAVPTPSSVYGETETEDDEE